MNQVKKEPMQVNFIEILRKAVPSNLNLADEVSHVLGISADSAYRRLRSETEFTLSEAITLCNHLDVPFESLNASHSEAVTFRTHNLNQDLSSFTNYMEGLYNDLTWLNKFDNAEIIYAAEDLPVFYSFLFPAISRFKMFYWTKSILNIPDMQRLKLEDSPVQEDWAETARKISGLFLQTKSIEIWNGDTLKSTLEQFRFYWEAGFFKEKPSAFHLLDEFTKLVQTIERQAEVGKKINPATGQLTRADFILYASDLMIGNNIVCIKGETKTASYIGYNSFNYMKTGNRLFSEQVDAWQKNLMSKSTLLTLVSEKQRNQFFKAIFTNIENLKLKIEQD